MMNFETNSKSVEDNVIQVQGRSMSDPPFFDIDFKNKMAWVWTTLKNSFSAFKISLKNGFTSIWSFLTFNVTIVCFNGAITRPTLGAVMRMGLELDMDLKRNSTVVPMLKLLGQVQLQGQPQR